MKVKKGERKCFVLLWALLKRFLANSSIHGIKYLVEDGLHWTERLFWLISCGFSWWGCTVLILGVLDDFSNRRTAVTVDTNYLDWSTELPSVHLCSTGTQQATSAIKETWGKKFGVAHKVDGTQNSGYDKALPKPHDVEAFEKIAKLLNLNCSDIFERCQWEGKSIDCCQAFRPISTTIGPCLSISSIFTLPLNSENAPQTEESFKIYRPQLNAFEIHLRANDAAMKNYWIYVLDRTGMPSVTTSHDKKLSTKWKTSLRTKIEVQQKTTHNEEGVRDVPVEKRNCRFANENEDMKIYRYYSYDACVAELFFTNMRDSCACISHVYPRPPGVPMCNQTQLQCAYEVAQEFDEKNFPRCPPDCEEINLTLFESFSDEKSSDGAHIVFNLLPGPTIRYVRYVVHSKIDVVVSVGGALGLFVGASILSLVEIPYWFLARRIGDDDDNEDERAGEKRG